MWGWGVFFYFSFHQILDMEQSNAGQTHNKTLSSSASFTSLKEKTKRCQKGKAFDVNTVSNSPNTEADTFSCSVFQDITARKHLKRHLKENFLIYIYKEFFQMTSKIGESRKMPV